MKYSILETHHNFLIISGNQDFYKGVLFPYNIVFDGEEMSLPFTINIMQKLCDDTSLLDNVEIISRFGEKKEYAILQYDCKDILYTHNDETILSENTTYKGKIIAKTGNTLIINVNGFFGFIDEQTENDIDDIIDVTLIQNFKNRFGFSRFCIAKGTEETISVNDCVSDNIEEFLTKEELSTIEEEDRELVQWVLDNISGITRSNINIVRERLHLIYNPTIQSDLDNFISDNPQYVAENNFWIGAYKDKVTNDVKLIIYDCHDVVFEVLVNDNGMWIQDFSHDRLKSNAQFLLNNNFRALVISGSNINLHKYNYSVEDNVITGEKIFNQLKVAKEIIPKLKIEIRTLKEKAGEEYLTLKQYLSYQEKKEDEYNKKNIAHIASNEASIITSTSHLRTALHLNEKKDVSSLFTEQDNDVCYAEIIKNDTTKINAELKMDTDNSGYILEFYHEHLDIDGLRKEGFDLRRRAGIRHLRLQKNSIDNFVYSKDGFDIFDKLNNGELVPPTPDDNIIFFDSKFVNTEEGNNQPLAIRKAINNNDIFLIQGPPGTGKTSVIVEIIKQLVINKKEKILVCSQAHSAVRNIYDRLHNIDPRIKIGNLDEEETMVPDEIEEHPEFIKNNEILLKKLSECNSTDTEGINQSTTGNYDYKSNAKKIFEQRHDYIRKYFAQNKPEDLVEWIDILSDLKKDLDEMGDDAKIFNNARHYQSLNVIMGTCIGIGLNIGLQRSGIKFDTVIIDEAGKANLSETTVPMGMGRKYILVGDNKQLPPYMDSEEISDFLKSENKLSLEQEEVENAISSSLFEDFLNDSNFPKESSILLNYQYRMNPDIGNYISELFYDEALKNGRNTEKQICTLDSFPAAVTFIDTSTSNREDSFEQGSAKEGWYNPTEVGIFTQRILPRLIQLITEESNISVGIITPYRRQRSLFLKAVTGTPLENAVYTIDSIQGSEFDIVILSLVRAFDTHSNRTVGFLDDMRRLNVALSRAKKKLIIIGNLDTLCDKKAHRQSCSCNGVDPFKVFQKLCQIKERTAERTTLDVLKREIESGRIKRGTVFQRCTWEWDDVDKRSILLFNIVIDGTTHKIPMKVERGFEQYLNKNKTIDTEFLSIDNRGKPEFRIHFNSKAEMIEEIGGSGIRSVNAKMVKWIKNTDNIKTALFRFDDGSEKELNLYEDISQSNILWQIIDNEDIGYISLFINDKKAVSLYRKHYDDFEKRYQTQDQVTIKVISEIDDAYIVQCEAVFGKVKKRRKLQLYKGQEATATIYRINSKYQNIIFNIINHE